MPSTEGYLPAIARLAQHLAARPVVDTPDGPGKLMVLDLDQDSGYAVGVRRQVPAPVFSKLFWYGPESVFIAKEQPQPEPVRRPLPPAFAPGFIDHSPIG